MTKRDATQVKRGAEYDVTMEDVMASGLIPNLDTMQLRFIGKSWFKDNGTGTAYHFIKDEKGALSIKETRQSISSIKNSLKATPKPKVEKVKTLVIKCVECDAERTIAVQDAFQVKRCVTCQRKHRNFRRSERLKAKNLRERLATA